VEINFDVCASVDEYCGAGKLAQIANKFLSNNTEHLQWGGVYGLFTLIAQAPTYFRFVHGWGIEMTGRLRL
jgi:hypothetical protein